MIEDFKTIIKRAHVELIMDGKMPNEPCEVRITRNGRLAETASWSFKDRRHHIFVGDKILEKLPIEALKRDDLDWYVQSYFFHEMGHALFTEKDLVAINNALKAEGIPFRVHNLFEDIRIESLAREAFSRKFEWMKYEAFGEYEDPLAKLFLMTQIEYGALSEDEQDEFLIAHDIDPKIADYYHGTTKCRDSWEVIELIKRWTEDYPLPPEEDINDLLNDLGMDQESDLSLSMEMQEWEVFFSQAVDSSEDIDSKEDSENSNDNPEVNEEKPLEEHSTIDFSAFRREDRVIYSSTIQKMLPKVMSIFTAKSSNTPSRRASKRLNVKGIISGSDHIYKRKLTRARTKKKFNFVIDCSGSMDGEPMNNAATIVSLFSTVARKGMADGHVILSSSRGYQTFKLPMSDEQISKYLHARAAEGFKNTFDRMEPILQNADTNFCITDGEITDGPLDKQALTRKGIHTFGLYGGNPDHCDLSPWFNRGIAREKLSELIDELVRNILVKPL